MAFQRLLSLCIISIFLIILSANVEGRVLKKEQYCNPTLCENGVNHIGCNNNGTLDASCPIEHEVVHVGEGLRRLILNEHNEVRMLVASGRLENYKPALRMATLHWDRELAQLAQLNAKQCRMEFDPCHSTKKFRRSGQNIFLASTEMSINDIRFVRLAVATWALESNFANNTIIRQNEDKTKALEIHSFANIVLDRNTHVGCGIVKYRREMNYFLMVCNYSGKTIQNQPIYVSSGMPGAGCLSGTNPARPSLCSLKEKY